MGQLLGALIFPTLLLFCFPGCAKFLALAGVCVMFAFLVSGVTEAIGIIPFLLICLVIMSR
jgi:hypothetical protein